MPNKINKNLYFPSIFLSFSLSWAFELSRSIKTLRFYRNGSIMMLVLCQEISSLFNIIPLWPGFANI